MSSYLFRTKLSYDSAILYCGVASPADEVPPRHEPEAYSTIMMWHLCGRRDKPTIPADDCPAPEMFGCLWEVTVDSTDPVKDNVQGTRNTRPYDARDYVMDHRAIRPNFHGDVVPRAHPSSVVCSPIRILGLRIIMASRNTLRRS